MTAARCAYDSGSATGCRPMCDRPAAVVLTHSGYGGPYAVPLCDGHVSAMRGRVWPDRCRVDPYPAAGAVRTCRDCSAPVTYDGPYGWRAAHWNRCTTADGQHRPNLAASLT